MPKRSRIVRFDASSDKQEVVFEGSEDTPFYTHIMGKHQWLANGNLLVTESRGGCLIEISPDGRPVWEYYNLIETGFVGLLDEAYRLSPKFSEYFFRALSKDCRNT